MTRFQSLTARWRTAALALVLAAVAGASGAIAVSSAAPDGHDVTGQQLAPSEAAPELKRIVPQTQEEVRRSYSPIVKKVSPAVVNVYVRSMQHVRQSPFFSDPMFERFFGRNFGVPSERMQNSLGSGVVVSPDGIVVTNNHVLQEGEQTDIKVAFADKREFKAKVVMRDTKADLAVLKLEADGETFPYMKFADSDGLEVGDLVLAVGNPFGVGQTVTSGIVSALSRTEVTHAQQSQIYIQTDAAINPGNSGGALVDMSGKLIGINTAIYSRSGGSHGIGFAIPSNLVRLVVNSALSGHKLQRPWLGAKFDDVTHKNAEALGLERISGALISSVYDGGPAAKAGLVPGDVVVAVDGRPVGDARGMAYRLTTKGVDTMAKLTVLRDGKKREIPVRLEPAPAGKTNVQQLSGRNPFNGASVADLSPALAEDLGLDTYDGAVVVDVAQGSYAARNGLQRGDIVVAVGQDRVSSVKELKHLVGQREQVWRVIIKRGDRLLRMVVPG